MKIVFISVLIAALEAAVPVWYNGTCGKSKYPDAGVWNTMQSSNSFGIINGEIARRHEFPWMAGLVLEHQGFPHPFCGAVIINERWIVTAAHCIMTFLSRINETQVVVGEHNTAERNKPNRKYHNISEALFPTGYRSNSTGGDDDIAFVKLKTAINITDNVRPICAPDPNDLYAHRQGIVSGWGDREGFKTSRSLRYAALNITTNAECKEGGGFGPELMPANQLCATSNEGEPDVSPCHGDSGAPLAVKDANGTFSFVGLLFGGKKNCTLGYPSIYMRVGHFVNMIATAIRDY